MRSTLAFALALLLLAACVAPNPQPTTEAAAPVVEAPAKDPGFLPADSTAILAIMARQQECWNAGDLECFMNGYWESDSLKFIGSRGLTYGWQSTLTNYQHSYPDTAAMGKLTFHILSVEQAGPRSAFVVGQWHLKRTKGNLQGHFSLLWKKLAGKWVIVADHSS